MLQLILNIIMWILIAFLVVLVAFWVYGMITSKDFRDANIEGCKASARERKRKRKKSKTFDNIFAFILIAIFLFLLLSL